MYSTIKLENKPLVNSLTAFIVTTFSVIRTFLKGPKNKTGYQEMHTSTIVFRSSLLTHIIRNRFAFPQEIKDYLL